MTISIQTIHDVLVAVAVTIGIAVAMSIALTAAGALFERDQARLAKGARPAAIPPRRPTLTQDTRELVGR